MEKYLDREKIAVALQSGTNEAHVRFAAEVR